MYKIIYLVFLISFLLVGCEKSNYSQEVVKNSATETVKKYSSIEECLKEKTDNIDIAIQMEKTFEKYVSTSIVSVSLNNEIDWVNDYAVIIETEDGKKYSLVADSIGVVYALCDIESNELLYGYVE